MKTQIIHEDRDILVIYKPAGLATQTAKIGQPDVVSELKNYLKTQGQSNPYLGVIHRLDQPVEGLLVFAKNKSAAASLTAQLQKQGEGGLNKHYYAVVCGKPAGNEGELVDYMYKSKENLAVIVEGGIVGKVDGAGKTGSAQMVGAAGKAALAQNTGTEPPKDVKKAVLRYRVVETEGSAVCLTKVDIEILTGRFHQIRAQMSHAGLPLLGDAKYGSEEAKMLAKQRGVQNVALCAYKLELTHPTTRKKLQFETNPKGRVFSLVL